MTRERCAVRPLEIGPQPVRVLLAEGDLEMCSPLARPLRDEGFDVTELSTEVALLAHPWDRFDLVISDIWLPGLSELQVLGGEHGELGFPPFILITEFGSDFIQERAKRLGAVAVFDRPFDVGEMLAVVRAVTSDRSSRDSRPPTESPRRERP